MNFSSFHDDEIAALAIAHGVTQAMLDTGWEGTVAAPRPSPAAWDRLKKELKFECKKRGLMGEGLDALYALMDQPACTSVLHHGPGHQSSTKCRLRGPHDIHEAVYGDPPTYAQWHGDEATTGFFDEPPEPPE